MARDPNIDEPRVCGECRWCVDVGFDPRSDHAICVRECEDGGDYEDIRATCFGTEACGHWGEW